MPIGQPNIHPLGQWLLSSLWPVHISMLLPVMVLNGVNFATHYQMIQKYCMRWYQNFMVESQFVSGDHILLRGAEKKRFQWIRENVLFPFINWGRKDYDDFDVDSSAPMGDELTAVSWCDGDHSQIDTIVSPDGIHRSKKLNKSTTVEHISSSNHLLKSKLESQFAKFNTKLRIKKNSAIIVYLAKQPTILSCACVRENVQSGFIASGMIDAHGLCMPVLYKLISTCKKVPSLSEYNMYLSRFDSLMKLS
jgi:hypothetical protein